MSLPILLSYVHKHLQSVAASATTENKHHKFNLSFCIEVKILECPLDFKPSLRMAEVQFPHSGHVFVYISFFILIIISFIHCFLWFSVLASIIIKGFIIARDKTICISHNNGDFMACSQSTPEI